MFFDLNCVNIFLPYRDSLTPARMCNPCYIDSMEKINAILTIYVNALQYKGGPDVQKQIKMFNKLKVRTAINF